MGDKMSSGPRTHVMCCAAVVFVCFVLTCLNLYMLSSTRDVLRRLDGDVRNQQLSPGNPGSPDFLILPSDDLDNAWATQTGADDGWNDMKQKLMDTHAAQQKHIEELQQQLVGQFRARDEQQRNQDQLMRENHLLQKMKQAAEEIHQQEMSRMDRELLKHKQRTMKYQNKLQKQREQKPDQEPLGTTPTPDAAELTTTPGPSTSAPDASRSTPEPDTAVLTHVEIIPPPVHPGAPDFVPFDHILGAVFGQSPGSFFFPGRMSRRKQPVDMPFGIDDIVSPTEEHHVVHRVLTAQDTADADHVLRRRRRDALDAPAPRNSRERLRNNRTQRRERQRGERQRASERTRPRYGARDRRADEAPGMLGLNGVAMPLPAVLDDRSRRQSRLVHNRRGA